MSDVITIVVLILVGPGLLAYVGFLVRQGRWRDSVPLIEVAIDRVVGIEPPPRNRTDHFFVRVQLILVSFIGLIMSCLFAVILFEAFGFTE